MYVALKHIGGQYTPGEVLPDNLPDGTLKWLLEAGAIQEIAPAPAKEPLKSQTLSDTSEQIEPKGEPTGTIKGDGDDEDIEDDEPEPPAIDPMEAVIPAKSAEEPKTTGKTGGRRKTK